MINAPSRRRYYHQFVGLLIASAVVGCRAEPTPPGEDPAPVHAQAAQKVVLGEWTDLLGTTQPLPNRSARISAAAEGHVVSILGDGKGAAVVEGQQVKVGQVIVRLDDRVPASNRDKLKATLDELDEQQIQAGFALELATIDVNRLKELGKTTGTLPLVSKIELERAYVLEKDAKSKAKGVAARQAAARADLRALESQLEFFTLRAPIAGRLSLVNAVPGQTLTPGTVVADVMDLSQIDALCHAPAQVAARLALDQSAKLIVEDTHDGGGPEIPPGKVVFIAVQAQPETGNVAVKARFTNPELRLRAHAIIRVLILTKPEKERLTIPEAALMEDRNIPMVVVAQDAKNKKTGDAEKHAKKLEVTLGVRDRVRGIAEILSLKDPTTEKEVSPEGLLFITEGAHGLQDGDVVKIEAEHKSDH